MLRLVSAVVVEAHDEWQVAQRRNLSEESMASVLTAGPSAPQPLSEAPLPVGA